VLRGETRGYRCHPQLLRFRSQRDPVGSLDRYLAVVHREARGRGYRFDGTKLCRAAGRARIVTTEGQLLFEWARLLDKVRARDPRHFPRIAGVTRPEAHPLFRIVPGPVEPWEKSAPGT
jgi:hypothetical protein